MKINTKAFIDFVCKASLNGYIETMNIIFTEDGLVSSVMDGGQTTMTLTRLNKDAIEEYEIRDEIYIKNTGLFLKVLKKLGDSFDFSIENDYVMKINTDKRLLHVMLGSEMACENKREISEPSLEFTGTFTVEKDQILPVLQDTRDLNMKQIVISISKEDGATFSVGDKNKTDYFVTKVNSNDTTQTGRVKLGEMFLNLCPVFTGSVNVSIKNDAPAKFTETTEFVEFTCIIAPIVEQ